MKIAIEILNCFAHGGIQRDLIFTAEALVRRGAEVVILAEHASMAAPAGCTLVTLPANGLTNHARACAFARRAATYLKAHPVDAVMGFNRLPGLDLYFAGDDALSTLWHNAPANAMLSRRRTFLALEKGVFAPNGAQRIFTLTERQERDYATCYQTAPSRFFRVGPGVSKAFQSMDRSPEARQTARAKFGVAPDKFMIVQAAVSFHTKGVDRLMNIIEALPAKLRAKVAVVAAGGDKEILRYRKAAKERNLPIIFPGAIDDVTELFAGANLMLHPARTEATGGVIAEALVAGVPVLTTELCGYAHFVNETQGGGVLPEPYDENAWTAELVKLLSHPELLDAFRSNVAELWRDDKWYGRHEVIADEVLRFAASQKEKIDASTRLYLGDFFKQRWTGLDPFVEVGKIDGTLYRAVKSRRTSRFEMDGRGFFLKHHHGCGWREIFKNLVQLKEPVLGAGNEFRALCALRKLGVPTMTPEAYGERGVNPAGHESFLVTAELTNAIDLAELTQSWRENPPTVPFKRALIHCVAQSAGTMHRAGINHRDCYLCHFLLDTTTQNEATPLVSMIDLHRAQIRKRVPYRYQVKDVAGLYFSSMDAGLTRRDFYRFMREYIQKPLHATLREDAAFWRAVKRAARKLYAKEHKRIAPEF